MSDLVKTGLEPADVPQAIQLARMVAESRICGVKSQADAMMRIMTGRMLGMSAMQSIMNISDIKGRPVLSSAAILALCINHPACEYFTLVETTDDHATFKTRRRGQDEVVYTYTREHAKKAGLYGNDNYNKQEATMYRWRCACALGRVVYPDAILGFYGREEFAGNAGPDDVPPVVTEVFPVLPERVQVVAEAQEVTPPPPSVALVPEADYVARVGATMSIEALKVLVHEAKRKLPDDAFQRIRAACSDKKRLIERMAEEMDDGDAREAEADVVHSAND